MVIADVGCILITVGIGLRIIRGAGRLSIMAVGSTIAAGAGAGRRIPSGAHPG